MHKMSRWIEKCKTSPISCWKEAPKHKLRVKEGTDYVTHRDDMKPRRKDFTESGRRKWTLWALYDKCWRKMKILDNAKNKIYHNYGILFLV